MQFLTLVDDEDHVRLGTPFVAMSCARFSKIWRDVLGDFFEDCPTFWVMEVLPTERNEELLERIRDLRGFKGVKELLEKGMAVGYRLAKPLWGSCNLGATSSKRFPE